MAARRYELSDAQWEQIKDMIPRAKRPGGKFCVSVFRQNQEYHIINVHDWGLFPLATSFPGGWDGMRAGRRECRPNLPGILMQGD